MAWERGRRDRAGDKGKEEEVCGGRERKSGSSAERSIGEGGKNLDAQTLGAACLGTGTTSEKNNNSSTRGSSRFQYRSQ